jgi:nucleotide-binding universal stress UspA family protein
MNSIPSVLCAVDLSHRSATVLQHAGAVAEHFRAQLTVVTINSGEASPVDALSSLMCESLPPPDAWMPARQVRVAAGQPAESILGIARDEGADLLVIGSHGENGDRGHAFGSTAEAILRIADVPVLVVPNSASDLGSLDDARALSTLGGVLAPIDFSPLSRRDARIAARIAESLDVPLLLVHVTAATPSAPGVEPEMAQLQLDELRREIAGATPTETVVVPGQPAEAIAAIAAERKIELVVMGLRGASGADGPRPGSIAYHMLCLTPAMLLALPPVLRRAAPVAPVITYARL